MIASCARYCILFIKKYKNSFLTYRSYVVKIKFEYLFRHFLLKWLLLLQYVQQNLKELGHVHRSSVPQQRNHPFKKNFTITQTKFRKFERRKTDLSPEQTRKHFFLERLARRNLEVSFMFAL